MRVYAFDVDECLEVSKGPILLKSLKELKNQGHAVGLCGNLNAFCTRVPRWPDYISFTTNFDTGPYLGGLLPKALWLKMLKETMFPGAEDYVMVGNVHGRVNSLGHTCGSHDDVGARDGGWRFIVEDAFAAGER